MPEPRELIEGAGTGSMSKDHEIELIARLQQKDEQAFQMLIDSHGHAIRRLVNRLTAFDSESEDVLQQVWLVVWRKAKSFRHECSFRTWITRIAIRQARNHHRALTRWWNRAERFWARGSHCSLFESAFSLEDDPRWNAIQRAMAKLNFADREILVLIYLQEQSIAELVVSMQTKPNTLEVRLHRAKQKLKQIIANQSKQP